MKQLITTLSLFAILLIPAMSNAQNLSNQCVAPKGELLGQINQLEAQGYTLISIECNPVNYLVAPTPPYVNNVLTITMYKIQCPEEGMGAPCILLGTLVFHADEVVMNGAGTTVHTNISPILIAL